MNNILRKKTKLKYAVAIRTLGLSGEKYVRLLDSIKRQKIQPEQIIVVLPEGYEAPKYTIGYETIVFAPKGMIIQRLEALKYISCDYVLFCDDDIEFNDDFIEKLSEPLVNGLFDCSAGPLLDFFPPAGPKYVIASLLGGACIMLHGTKQNYVRILNTGGWSYNRRIDTSIHKYYGTESLPWTCFFIKTETMRAIKFEDELWLEQSGYAAFEDRVMFYKLLKNGFKTCIVSDAKYIHNDAKTSIQMLRLEPIYAGAFNHYVFWHRYIYNKPNRIAQIWSKICITYYTQMQELYSFILLMIKRNTKEVHEALVQGFKDAKKYVKSQEYKNLPPINGINK